MGKVFLEVGGAWEQTPCFLQSVEPRPAPGSGPLLGPPCKLHLFTSSFQTTAWIDADVTLGRSTEALESPLVPDFAGKDAELRSQVNIKPALSCLSPCPPPPTHVPWKYFQHSWGSPAVRNLLFFFLESSTWKWAGRGPAPWELAARCEVGLLQALLSWEATLPAVVSGNSGKRPCREGNASLSSALLEESRGIFECRSTESLKNIKARRSKRKEKCCPTQCGHDGV